jgi:ribosomal protein L29
MALQQHTAQLTEKYDNLKAEYVELKASHAQQRAEQRTEFEQLKASQAQQKAEYEAAHEQQKAAYEQLHAMIMNLSNSGTCAPNPFLPYNHQPTPGSPPPPPAPSSLY